MQSSFLGLFFILCFIIYISYVHKNLLQQVHATVAKFPTNKILGLICFLLSSGNFYTDN